MLITPIESKITPGTITHRQWKINPYWVLVREDGSFAVHGQPDMFLRKKTVKDSGVEVLDPFSAQDVDAARQNNLWIIALAHPHVAGLVVERTVPCDSTEVRRFRFPFRLGSARRAVKAKSRKE